MKTFYDVIASATRIIALSIILAHLTACGFGEPLPNMKRSTAKSADSQLDGLLLKFDAAVSADEGERARILDALGLKEAGAMGKLAPRWFRVILKDETSTLNDARTKAQSYSSILAIEGNVFVYSHATPNDVDFSLQYYLDRNAPEGTVDPDIDAPLAWDTQTGAPVVVAVLDTGIDLNHPDLKENIWVNTAEIAGNEIDDDGNGFVDDINGWNFQSNTNQTQDDNGHGTHIAGIIGARSNNGEGIAGINGRARILAVKFLNNAGQGTVFTAVKALEYAIDNGAVVSNLSWGTDVFSLALFDAIEMAGLEGHLVVASVGNNGHSLDEHAIYPASFELDNVISVASTNESLQMASFSNYSAHKANIAAPGVGIYSSYVMNQKMEGYPAGYGILSGTSASAAIVTGVVSLIYSQDNNLKANDLKQAVLGSARKVGALAQNVSTSGVVSAALAIENTPSNGWSDEFGTQTFPEDNVVLSGFSPLITPDFSIGPDNVYIASGQQLEVIIKGGVAPYTWQSSNQEVGSVVDTWFSATKIGETQLVATDANGAVSNVMHVFVTDISADVASNTVLLVNDTIQVNVLGGIGPFEWKVLGNANAVSLQMLDPMSRSVSVKALTSGNFQLAVMDTSASSVLEYVTPAISVASQSVAIASPLSTSLLINEVLQLQTTSVAGTITWASSNTAVATISETGLLTAVGIGTTTIIASNALGQLDTLVIIVNNASISIQTPVTDTIWVGNVTPMQLFVAGGAAPFNWISATSDIVSVDANGKVSAVNFTPSSVADASRTAIIVVIDALGNSASLKVRVNKLFVSSPVDALSTGQTIKFNVLSPSNTLLWNVTGTGSASVNPATMELTALSAGNIVVTVVDENGVSASSKNLQVNSLPIAIAATTYSELWIGNNNRNTILLSANNGQPVYTWVSDNPSVASVDASTGLVTASQPGNVKISVNDSVGNTASMMLTVKKFAISTPSSSVRVFDSLQLSSNGFGSVNWFVDNATIAGISQGGLLNAKAAGIVNVYAFDEIGNTTSIAVQVEALSPLLIGNGIQTLWKGSANTTQFTASGGIAPYVWSVNDQSIITVDQFGLVTAVSSGTATVMVKDTIGNVAVTQVTVQVLSLSATSYSVAELDSVLLTTNASGAVTYTVSGTGSASVNPDTGVLTALKSGDITVTLTDGLGNTKTIALTITPVQVVVISQSVNTTIWLGVNVNKTQLTASGGNGKIVWVVKSGTGVVAVDATGMVTAKAVGTATIAAVDPFGRSDTIVITVSQVQINQPSTTSIRVGRTLQFTGIGAGSLAWTVDDTSRATIDSNGLLTAKNTGTVNVSMRDANSNTAVNVISVTIRSYSD
ncbi:MAG: S8 family serine peptidase [Gammaproteobacteria bacterium]|nr:S8 family serine peptidase [Gammaproteobacteria bacterium]